MGANLRVILMIFAVVCFLFAALGVKPQRGELVPAGLAFWALAVLIG